MKNIALIPSLLLIIVLSGCNSNEQETNKQTEYFLQGNFNGSSNIILEYPSELYSDYYYGDYYWGSASDNSYASEGPILTFPFNTDNSEFLSIVFHQKFDNSKFTDVSELPLINNIDVLLDTLNNMNLQFYCSFNNNSDYQGIEIRYFKDNNWWHSFTYQNGIYSSQVNNENHDFVISGISKHANTVFGDGLLIEGVFSCELYNLNSPQEIINCQDMKFKGFLKFPRH